jgi:hypothetical protein
MEPEFGNLYKITEQGKWHYRKDAWTHTMDVIRNIKPTLEHRLAALFHDIGKGKTYTEDKTGIHFFGHQFVSQRVTKNFMRRYKYTTEQIEWVSNSVMMHMNFLDQMLDKTIRKMVNKYGKDQFLFFTDLGLADSKRPERKESIQRIIHFVHTDDYVPEVPMKLPIDGNMIMEELEMKAGKQVGELLAIEKNYLFEYPEASLDDLWVVLYCGRGLQRNGDTEVCKEIVVKYTALHGTHLSYDDHIKPFATAEKI